MFAVLSNVDPGYKGPSDTDCSVFWWKKYYHHAYRGKAIADGLDVRFETLSSADITGPRLHDDVRLVPSDEFRHERFEKKSPYDSCTNYTRDELTRSVMKHSSEGRSDNKGNISNVSTSLVGYTQESYVATEDDGEDDCLFPDVRFDTTVPSRWESTRQGSEGLLKELFGIFETMEGSTKHEAFRGEWYKTIEEMILKMKASCAEDTCMEGSECAWVSSNPQRERKRSRQKVSGNGLHHFGS